MDKNPSSLKGMFLGIEVSGQSMRPLCRMVLGSNDLGMETYLDFHRGQTRKIRKVLKFKDKGIFSLLKV